MRLQIATLAQPQAQAILLPSKLTRLPASIHRLDEGSGGAVSALLGRKEFTAERGTVVALYPDRGPKRLWIVGLGETARLDAGAWLLAGAKLAQAAIAAGVETLAIGLPDELLSTCKDSWSPEQVGRLIGDGLGLGAFEFKRFKGTASPGPTQAGRSGSERVLKVAIPPAYCSGLARALAIAPSVEWARTLAATPPNIANPTYLARQVRAMAAKVGLSCRVLEAASLRRMGMNALLAVGGAGSAPPCLVVLEWKGQAPRSSATKKPPGPLLLVGKAVTFDTGGYSLKPAESMPAMKYDKCGGMVVLGVMHALAALRHPGHVVGLIPCVENLVGSRAYRPADILRACNGVTIEVTNTDAEGRLILADALAWGCQIYRPRMVVDLATLTGGVVVGLGTHAAGLFTTHQALRDALVQAGMETGERVWPLPLWEEYRQQIKGQHADIVNSAGREGSPCTAAAFLSYFASADGSGDAMSNPPPQGWAHLDIAGVSDFARAGPLHPPGPTGFGIRLLLRWLEQDRVHDGGC